MKSRGTSMWMDIARALNYTTTDYSKMSYDLGYTWDLTMCSMDIKLIYNEAFTDDVKTYIVDDINIHSD